VTTRLEQQLASSLMEVRAKKLREKMSNESQAIVIQRTETTALDFSEEQVTLLRDSYASGATEPEFRVLLEVARARRLNPFLKQIYFIKRKAKDDEGNWRWFWSTQVSIDGMRAIAQRTGLYDGQDEPEFERNAEGLILAARVRVYRKDWGRPAVGVARWDEYVQTTRDVRVESVVMERTETRINAVDLAKNEKRQFRLDRIEHAEVVSPS
jgi:phage recombination protein Bet